MSTNDRHDEYVEKAKAKCGCTVGDLHRYACASVGHVDTPRPADPLYVTVETILTAREQALREERDAAREALARVEALADEWADADAGQARTHQRHARLDCERDLRAALRGETR